MWDALRCVTAPPVFASDEEKTRAAGVFTAFLWCHFLLVALLGGLFIPLFVVRKPAAFSILGVWLLALIGMWGLLRVGRVRLAAILWLCMGWAITTCLALFAGGITSGPSFLFASIPITAGILLGQGGALVSAGACILGGMGLTVLEAMDALPPRYFPDSPGVAWGTLAIGIVWTIIPLNALLRSLAQALAMGGRQLAERTQAEAALARRTQQLETRSRQLEAIRAIGTEIARELDLGKVLQLISRRLGELIGRGRGGVCLWHDGAQVLVPHTHYRPDDLQPQICLRLGQGVAGRVAERREGLIVNDYRSWPGVPPEVLARTRITAMMAEPLVYHDRLVGVIHMDTEEPGAGYTEDDRELLRLLATQTAIAIENARLYETARRELAERTQAEAALARRTQQLEAVRAISEEIIREMRLPALLELIVDHARRLVDGAGGSVLFWDDARRVLVPSTWVGRPAATRAIQIGPGEGISGSAAVQRKGLIVNDYRSSPLARPAMLQHSKISAAMAEPLLYQDRLVGVINIDNGDTGRTFSAEHGELLRLLATHAAIAIENARLFQEQQRALERLRHAQEELVRTEKLRALGQMSAGIAHDLNNMLAAILGQTELLRLRVKLPEVQEALKVLYTAASDGAQVVRRLMDFGRQQPRRPLVPCDLASLADEALEITRPRWQDEAQVQGRLIEIWRSLENIPRVQGDPSEIREALSNLILNAVDAMPTGGRLTLAGYTAPDAAAPGTPDWVVLTVGDTGMGMSEETRGRIFDPFFTTKGLKGTGLGLAVTYGILKRHGGKIEVASTPGQGTIFTVWFRRAAAPQVPSPGEESPPAPVGLRVLLIDDEDPVRGTLASLLRAVGHTVLEADGGERGLACLAGGPVELVITDLGMPGMTGWEVARRVKAAHPRLPVILLSGWGQQISGSTPGCEHVDMVLAKPIRLEELQAAIARVVDEKQGRGDAQSA
jgi:signal transduction histidine kinase/CheY-like chemotaxis protein